MFADVLEMLYELFGGVIGVMRSMQLVSGVSLFTFCIAIAVLGIVITFLLPVARNPQITTRSRRERREKKGDK